jgi:hypothetical protein
MDDMKIWIMNLDAPEAETSSVWVTLPCAVSIIKERIGLPENNDHYLIRDYELPFEITHDTDLALINELCENLCDCEFPYEDIRAIQKAWFGNLSEMEYGLFNITRYDKCSTLEEVATHLINECNELGEVSPQLYPYINYKAYADTLESLGNFLCVRGSVYEYCE